MAKVNADKIKERYLKARSEWQEQLKRERVQRRKQKAKDDLERKVVAGEFLLSLVESGEWPRERFLSRLDAILTDNWRRELFGLSPVNETSNASSVSAETSG